MENNKLAKIMILDATAGHGQYISKMFIKDRVVMTSNYGPHKLEDADKDATLIYVLSNYEELKELEELTKNHFRNVVVCSERIVDPFINCKKPLLYVSLNALKDEWMKAVFQALYDLNGTAIYNCFTDETIKRYWSNDT